MIGEPVRKTHESSHIDLRLGHINSRFDQNDSLDGYLIYNIHLYTVVILQALNEMV